MSWFYKDQLVNSIPENIIGMVYLITDLDNQRLYVGKKLFFFKKRKKIKGKRDKILKIESDWQDYFGSNEELQNVVAMSSKDKFKREILYFCETKSEMSYLESKEIFLRDALLKKEYYNSWVSCKINRKQLKVIK